jgi:hypothetical protein
MAQSPKLKIYRNGKYIAACKHTEDAAAICGMTEGTQVRYGHSGPIIFTEGKEEVWAGDSWDGAAIIMEQRIAKFLIKDTNEVQIR